MIMKKQQCLTKHEKSLPQQILLHSLLTKIEFLNWVMYLKKTFQYQHDVFLQYDIAYMWNL